jgi:hypothetical protein
MGCRKVQALGPLVAAVVVVASGVAEAAWWKGLNSSKDGSLNNDYWDGFGISYETWYSAGGHDSINAARWESEEAIFELKDTRYTVSLSNDFACRNVTAFQGVTGGQMTMDLNGHDFATVNGAWGFFFKGTNGDIVVSNGTFSVKKEISVGNDNGNGNTMTVVDTKVLYPESIGVGRGTSTGNTFVVDKGSVVMMSNSDGHANWGIVVGQNAGEDGNSMIVRNGGVVTNTASTMYIGCNTSGNSLRVENGGYLYRNNYTHLGNVSDTSKAPSGNSIVVDGAGSEIYIESHFMIGENVDTQFKNLGNKVIVSDGGLFRCKNDFQIRSSGNEVIVSNGTIRLEEGGLRLATAAENGVTGNKLTVAGRSPWIRTSYDFMAVNGAVLKFVVPAGGYVAPEGFAELNESFGDNKSNDGGYDYVPVTAGVFLTIGADTTLEVDALEFSKSIMHATTIPLIRGCGYGNDSSVTPEMIAAWNENLPDGCTVSMMGDKYTSSSSDWGQKTLMLTVKPYNNGMRVMIR